jgi:hypothetical protein
VIRHVWTILCSRASIDTETNNVSLFDVIEQLNIMGPLAEERGQVAFPHEIVSLWSRESLEEAGTAESRYTIVAPSGWTTNGPPIQVDLTRTVRLRVRGRPAAFPVEGPGLYWVVVEARENSRAAWAEVVRIPIEVTIQVAPAD